MVSLISVQVLWQTNKLIQKANNKFDYTHKADKTKQNEDLRVDMAHPVTS